MNPMFAQRLGASGPPLTPEEERVQRLEAQLRALGRGLSPDATRVTPNQRGGSSIGGSLADVGRQFLGASAGMVSRFGEGAARTLAAPMPDASAAEQALTALADRIAENDRITQRETAPRTEAGRMARIPLEMGVSVLPYVAAGAGLPGLARSAGMTALESNAQGGSLVETMAGLTGSDALQRLAESPYRTAADVGIDVAANALPGAPAAARALGRNVGRAATVGRALQSGDELATVVRGGDDPAAEAFIASRNRTKRPGFLSPLSPEELAGRRITLRHGGKAGYALTPEGDLQNIFNNGAPKGAGQELILDGLRHGGRTLDAFDGYLPELYSRFGFAETGRVPFNREYAPPGWDFAEYGEPDVVFMANKATDDEAALRARLNSPATPVPRERTAQYFSEYDDAARNNVAAAETYARAGGAGAPSGALERAFNDAAGGVLVNRAGGDVRGLVESAMADLAGVKAGARRAGRNADAMLRSDLRALSRDPWSILSLGALGASAGASSNKREGSR